MYNTNNHNKPVLLTDEFPNLIPPNIFIMGSKNRMIRANTDARIFIKPQFGSDHIKNSAN